MISDRYNNCYWEADGETTCRPNVPNVNYRATDFSQHVGLSPRDQRANCPTETVKIHRRMLDRGSPIRRFRLGAVDPPQVGGDPHYGYRFARTGEGACRREIPPLEREKRPPPLIKQRCRCRYPTTITDRVISKFPNYHIFNPTGRPHVLENSHYCLPSIRHERHYRNPSGLAPRGPSPHYHKEIDRLRSDLDCHLKEPPTSARESGTLREGRACHLSHLTSYFPSTGDVEQYLVQKLGRPSLNNSHVTEWNSRGLRYSIYSFFRGISLNKVAGNISTDPFPHKSIVSAKLSINLPATCRYSNLPVRYVDGVLTVSGPSLEFICAVIAFLTFSSSSPYTFSCKLLKRNYLDPAILSDHQQHIKHLRIIWRYISTTTERIRCGSIERNN
jgi:hypothetical protein